MTVENISSAAFSGDEIAKVFSVSASEVQDLERPRRALPPAHEKVMRAAPHLIWEADA